MSTMISNPPHFKGGRCRWPTAITRCRSAGSMKRWHRPRVGANEKVVKGFKAATMHLGVRWVRPAMRNVSRSASRHRAGFAGTAATRKCRFINVATVSLGGKHTHGISAPNMQRVAMLGSSRLDKDPSSRIQLHVKRSNARRSSPGRR